MQGIFRPILVLSCVCAASPAHAAGSDAAGVLFGVFVGIALLVAVGVAFYFLPAIIAFVRGHEFRWVIFAINLAAGWTLLGWAIALVWAIWPRDKALVHPFVGNPTGLSSTNAGDAIGAAAFGRTRGYRIEAANEHRFTPSVTDEQLQQLERLAKLLSAGALSQQEFETHKRSILGGPQQYV